MKEHKVRPILISCHQLTTHLELSLRFEFIEVSFDHNHQVGLGEWNLGFFTEAADQVPSFARHQLL